MERENYVEEPLDENPLSPEDSRVAAELDIRSRYKGFNNLSRKAQESIVNNREALGNERIENFDGAYLEGFIDQAEAVPKTFPDDPDEDETPNYVALKPEQAKSRIETRMLQLQEEDPRFTNEAIEEVKEEYQSQVDKGNWVAPMLVEDEAIQNTNFTEWTSVLKTGEALSEFTRKDNEMQPFQSVGYSEAGIGGDIVDYALGLGELAARQVGNRLAGITEAAPLITANIFSLYDADNPLETQKRMEEFWRDNYGAQSLRTSATELPPRMQKQFMDVLNDEGVVAGADWLASYLAFVSGDAAVIGGFAAGGAALGTATLPIVGTVAGGTLGAVVGAGVIGLSSASNTYYRLRDQGVDMTTAAMNANGDGAITTALSLTVLGNKVRTLLGATSATFAGTTAKQLGKEVWKRTAIDMASDGGIMVAGELAYAVNDVATGVDPSALDTDNLGPRMLSSGGLGFAIGGAFGLPVRTFTAARRLKLSNKTRTLGDSFEGFKQNYEGASNKEAAASTFREAVNRGAEQGRVPEYVYIDREVLTNRADAPPWLKEYANSYDAPLNRDGLVPINPDKVPISTDKIVTAYVNGEDLTPFMRREPTGPTVEQARRDYEAAAEFFDAEYEKSIRDGRDENLQTPEQISEKQIEKMQELDVAMEKKAVERPQKIKRLKEATDMDGEGPTPLQAEEVILDGDDYSELALGVNRKGKLEAEDAFRAELDKDVNQMVKDLSFTDEQLIAGEGFLQFYEYGTTTPINMAKVQDNIYRGILDSQSYANASNIKTVGKIKKLDRAALKKRLGDKAYNKLTQTQPDLLAPKGTEGALTTRQFADEVGMSMNKFEQAILSDEFTDISKYETLEEWARARAKTEAEASTKVLDNFVEMYQDDASKAVDILYSKGVMTRALGRMVTPELDVRSRKEMKRIEGKYSKEFGKQESGLLKFKRSNKELKELAKSKVDQMDYKDVVRTGVTMKTLMAETEKLGKKIAKSVKDGNILESYKYRGDQLVVRAVQRELLKRVVVMKRAQKALDNFKGGRKTEAELVGKGYDLDAFFGLKYALEQNGLLKTTRGKMSRAAKQMQYLEQNDPVKYERVVSRVNHLIPDEKPESLTVAEYSRLVSGANNMLKASLDENRLRSGFNKQETTLQLAKGLSFLAMEVQKKRTNGVLQGNVAAKLTDGVLDLDSVINPKDMNDLVTAIDNEMAALTTRRGEDAFGSMAQGADDIIASLTTAVDFLRRLEDTLTDLKKPQYAEAFRRVRREVMDGESNFLDDYNTRLADFHNRVNSQITKNSKKLFPNKDVNFMGKTYKSDQLVMLLLNMGNESNLEILANRNFGGVGTGRLVSEVGRLIEEGVITKEHFDFIRTFGDMNKTLLPEIQESYKRIYGSYFNTIDIDTTPLAEVLPEGWGVPTDGWYFPVMTNKVEGVKFLTLSGNNAETALTQGQMGDVFRNDRVLFADAKEMSFEKARTVDREIPLTLELPRALRQYPTMLKSIHVRERALNVAEMLSNPSVTKAMSMYKPNAMNQILIPWVKNFGDQTMYNSRLGDAHLENASLNLSSVVNSAQQRVYGLLVAHSLRPAILNVTEAFKGIYELSKDSSLPVGTRQAAIGTEFTARLASSMAESFIGNIGYKTRVSTLMDTSPYMRTWISDSGFRAQNTTRKLVNDMDALEQVFRLGGMSKVKGPKLKAAIENWGQWFNQYSNKHIATSLHEMAARRYLKQNPGDYTGSILAGDDMVQKVLPSVRSSEQAALFSGTAGTFGRLVQPFATWMVKSANYAGNEVTRLWERDVAQHLLTSFGVAGGVAIGMTVMLPAFLEETTQADWWNPQDVDKYGKLIKDDPFKALRVSAVESIPAGLGRFPIAGTYARESFIDTADDFGYEFYITKPSPFYSRSFLSTPLDSTLRVAPRLGDDATRVILEDLFNTSTKLKKRESGEIADDLMWAFGFITKTPLGPLPRKLVKYVTNTMAHGEDMPDSYRDFVNLLNRGEVKGAPGSKTSESGPRSAPRGAPRGSQ